MKSARKTKWLLSTSVNRDDQKKETLLLTDIKINEKTQNAVAKYCTTWKYLKQNKQRRIDTDRCGTKAEAFTDTDNAIVVIDS